MTTESIVNALSENSVKEKKKCSTCGKSHEGKCKLAAKVGAVTTDNKKPKFADYKKPRCKVCDKMLTPTLAQMENNEILIE